MLSNQNLHFEVCFRATPRYDDPVGIASRRSPRKLIGGLMNRREFGVGLCCAHIAMPFVALGQQTGRVYRLGILEAVPATRNGANLDSLRKGLRDLGYIEGQNLL